MTGECRRRWTRPLLRAVAAIATVLGVFNVFGGIAVAQQSCTKAEFETVVDDAAASLRDLNLKNKPEFHEKLRVLKDKRGWTQDQFLKEAAPFVKDDKIEVFDQTSNELLAKISSMGEEGSAAKVPDCALLSELHETMNTLVSTQTEKWSYMFGKLDAELAK